MTFSYRWLTHTHVRTYTDRGAQKTATLGNGEFPKPQSAWEGEGSHGKAGCLHAVPPSEPTGLELKQTEQRKDQSKIIRVPIWQRKSDSISRFKGLWVRFIRCGRSAGRSNTHVGVREVEYSSALSLTQFGKTQIRGRSRCPGLRGQATPKAPPNLGAQRKWGEGGAGGECVCVCPG